MILQLIKSKCIPDLLYGLEVCTLNKSEIASLHFVINLFFVKLFQTNNIEIVRACQELFGFELSLVLYCLSELKKIENRFFSINLCLLYNLSPVYCIMLIFSKVIDNLCYFFRSVYIFNFIRCSIEQQPHKKQLKTSK